MEPKQPLETSAHDLEKGTAYTIELGVYPDVDEHYRQAEEWKCAMTWLDKHDILRDAGYGTLSLAGRLEALVTDVMARIPLGVTSVEGFTEEAYQDKLWAEVKSELALRLPRPPAGEEAARMDIRPDILGPSASSRTPREADETQDPQSL